MPSLLSSKKQKETFPVQVYAGRVPCSFVVQVTAECSIEEFFGLVWKQYGPASAAVRIDAKRNDSNPDDETWCMTSDGRILKDGDTQLLKTYIPLGTGFPKVTLHSRRDLFDEGKQVAQANRKRVAWLGVQPMKADKSAASPSANGNTETKSISSSTSTTSTRPSSLHRGKPLPLEPSLISLKLPPSDTISHRRDLVPLSVAAKATSSNTNNDLVVVVSYCKRNSRIGRGGEWEVAMGEIGPCDPLDLRLAIQRTGAFLVWTDMDMEGTERDVFDAVVGAIGSAWAMIIAFSDQYVRSARGKRELYAAISSRTKYIPIALGDKPYIPSPTSLATYYNITNIIDCTQKPTAPTSLREVAKQLQVLQAAEHWAPDLETKLMQFMRGDAPPPKPADRSAKNWRDGDAIEVAFELGFATNEEHAAGRYCWVRATVVSTADAFGANPRYRVAYQPEGLPSSVQAAADWVPASHVRPLQVSSPPWQLGIIQPGRAVEVRKLWAGEKYTWWAGRFVGVWNGWYRIAFDGQVGGEFFVDPRQVRVAGTWEGLGVEWKPLPTPPTQPSESKQQVEGHVLSRSPSHTFYDQGLVFVSFDYDDSDMLRDEADEKKHLVDPVEVVKRLESAGWRVQAMPRRIVGKDGDVSVMDLASLYSWHLQDMNDAIALVSCVSSSYFSTPYARVEFNIIEQAMGVPVIPLILNGSWWESARENEIRVNPERVIDCTWTFDFDDRMKQLVGVVGQLEQERLGISADGRRASLWSDVSGSGGKEEPSRMSVASVVSDDDNVPLGQRNGVPVANGYSTFKLPGPPAPVPPPKGSSRVSTEQPRSGEFSAPQQPQLQPKQAPVQEYTPSPPSTPPTPSFLISDPPAEASQDPTSPRLNPHAPKFAPPRPSPLRNAVSRPPSIDSDVSRASFNSEREDPSNVDSLGRHRRGSSGAFKNPFRRLSASAGVNPNERFVPTPVKGPVVEEEDGEYAFVAGFADKPGQAIPVQPHPPVQPQLPTPPVSRPMTPVVGKEKEKEASTTQRMSSFFGLKKKKSRKEGEREGSVEYEKPESERPPNTVVIPDVAAPTPPARKAFAGKIDKSMISGPVELEDSPRGRASLDGDRGRGWRDSGAPVAPIVSAPIPVQLGSTRARSPSPLRNSAAPIAPVVAPIVEQSYEPQQAYPTPAATPVRPARSRSRSRSPARATRSNSRSRSPRRAVSPVRGEEEDFGVVAPVPIAPTRTGSPEPFDRASTPPSPPRSSPSPRTSLDFVQTGPPPRRPSKSGARRRTNTPPPQSSSSPSTPPSPPRPTSSIPVPAQSVPTQPSNPTPEAPTARGGGPVRTVLKPFISDRMDYGDEVDLHVGDTVVVRTIFADGWCEGVNVTSGKSGMFPAESVGLVADKGEREKMLVPRY